MAIKEAAPNALAHIKDGQIDPKALLVFCNSFSIGPLVIDYCVDTSIPQLTFTVTLAGVKIGSGVLNAQNPTVTVGGSVFKFTAQVTLSVDLAKREVTYDIMLCVPIAGCKQFTGVLFSW